MSWVETLKAFMTSTGPLWGIAGTLAGVLVANRQGRKNAADQLDHQMRVKHHDQRLEAYAEFISALKAYNRAEDILTRLGNKPMFEHAQVEARNELNRRADRHRAAALKRVSVIMLVGNDEVRKRASEVTVHLHRIEQVKRDTSIDWDEVADENMEVLRTTHVFEQAGRDELAPKKLQV
jgi:hypothetical protein